MQGWRQPGAHTLRAEAPVTWAAAGPHLDGESLYNLMEAQKCTLAAGVPTVFMALLQHLRSSGRELSTLSIMNTGGAACPPLLLEVLAGCLQLSHWHFAHLLQASVRKAMLGRSAASVTQLAWVRWQMSA